MALLILQNLQNYPILARPTKRKRTHIMATPKKNPSNGVATATLPPAPGAPSLPPPPPVPPAAAKAPAKPKAKQEAKQAAKPQAPSQGSGNFASQNLAAPALKQEPSPVFTITINTSTLRANLVIQ